MRYLVACALIVLSTAGTEAQQLPTAGELIGKGSLIVGESLEGRLNGGYAQLVYAGYGLTEKLDIYAAVGEGNGTWFRGVGVSFTGFERGPIKVNGALFVRSNFKSGYGITPRITVMHEVSDRFAIFGGLTVLNGPRRPRATGVETPQYTPTITYLKDYAPTEIVADPGPYPLPASPRASVSVLGIPLPIGFTYRVTERWTVVAESAIGILGSQPVSGRFAASYKIR
ncbi:MAG: hypothetical protein AAB780_00605 [Patescibacteria group bacterium]